MTSLGILFALFAMIFWGFEEFFLKEAIRGLKSLTTFVINTLVSVAVIFLAVFFLFPERVGLVSFEDISLLAVIAVIGFFASLLFYLALEEQELSLVASLDESWIVIATLIAVFVFGEVLLPLHILAIAIILLGVWFISVDISRLRHIRLISGSKYELLSVVLIGVNVPLEKLLVTRIGEAAALFYLALLFLPLLVFAKSVVREDFSRPTRKLLTFSILSGACDGLAFSFFLLALTRLEVSIVSPLVASNVLVSILLARMYLKERMTAKEIVGACFILAGVVTLSAIGTV